ncbi:MAG: acyl-protein synthetase [Oscillospiraceae bacterium]|nr:acyl-protein synthetase [Oscillospiraceae bacterium]MCL2279463.1 acyl-protein synthetase [Oscillospiraceae bacterium]
MISYDDFYAIAPFSLGKSEKKHMLTQRLLDLTNLHIEACPQYADMMRGIGFSPSDCKSYFDIPFLPVSLFKDLELLSVEKNDVVKTMTSSGTTGQAVSKIYLNKATAANQQKTLAKIVSDFTGASRMPMIIIDSPSVLKDRSMFSARGAGILGFSIFGTDRIYALDENMELDIPAIENFLSKHKGKNILLFGFTSIVWQHFYLELKRKEHKLDLSDGILIHGGGWKKLINQAVSKAEYKNLLRDLCGLSNIHDYYGMVEQTGCIYVECEHGHLHASVFSDIIMRRHIDFSPCDFGQSGIVQVVSVIAESYPGHSLLTEDEGVILGEDTCPCGRLGKFFHISGRLKQAEIRGCSDTYEGIR